MHDVKKNLYNTIFFLQNFGSWNIIFLEAGNAMLLSHREIKYTEIFSFLTKSKKKKGGGKLWFLY